MRGAIGQCLTKASCKVAEMLGAVIYRMAGGCPVCGSLCLFVHRSVAGGGRLWGAVVWETG